MTNALSLIYVVSSLSSSCFLSDKSSHHHPKWMPLPNGLCFQKGQCSQMDAASKWMLLARDQLLAQPCCSLHHWLWGTLIASSRDGRWSSLKVICSQANFWIILGTMFLCSVNVYPLNIRCVSFSAYWEKNLHMNEREVEMVSGIQMQIESQKLWIQTLGRHYVVFSGLSCVVLAAETKTSNNFIIFDVQISRIPRNICRNISHSASNLEIIWNTLSNFLL